MKKLLTQTIVLVIALAIGVSTFAQSPTTATRQRRTSADAAQPAASDQKTATDAAMPIDQAGDKSKDKSKTSTSLRLTRRPIARIRRLTKPRSFRTTTTSLRPINSAPRM